MRMAEISSCRISFTPSSFSCIMTKRGFTLRRQNAIVPMMKGRAHRTIREKSGLRRNMKYMLPRVISTVRTRPRTIWETRRSTWVTSLVMRVMREPVPKLSIWGKEKVMILRKVSLRSSFPIFWLAILTNTLLREPKQQPISTMPIICAPTFQISSRLPVPLLCSPKTPSSTMRLISPGWIKSISTSPPMNRAASTAKCAY